MTDTLISKLRKGQSVVLGGQVNGTRVIAERSGDGKTLRIVRESRDGYQVIRTVRF